MFSNTPVARPLRTRPTPTNTQTVTKPVPIPIPQITVPASTHIPSGHPFQYGWVASSNILKRSVTPSRNILGDTPPSTSPSTESWVAQVQAQSPVQSTPRLGGSPASTATFGRRSSFSFAPKPTPTTRRVVSAPLPVAPTNSPTGSYKPQYILPPAELYASNGRPLSISSVNFLDSAFDSDTDSYVDEDGDDDAFSFGSLEELSSPTSTNFPLIVIPDVEALPINATAPSSPGSAYSVSSGMSVASRRNRLAACYGVAIDPSFASRLDSRTSVDQKVGGETGSSTNADTVPSTTVTTPEPAATPATTPATTPNSSSGALPLAPSEAQRYADTVRHRLSEEAAEAAAIREHAATTPTPLVRSEGIPRSDVMIDIRYLDEDVPRCALLRKAGKAVCGKKQKKEKTEDAKVQETMEMVEQLRRSGLI